jgi:hypothetical protein
LSLLSTIVEIQGVLRDPALQERFTNRFFDAKKNYATQSVHQLLPIWLAGITRLNSLIHHRKIIRFIMQQPINGYHNKDVKCAATNGFSRSFSSLNLTRK